MAKALRFYEKRQRVEVCVGGKPIDPQARWVSGRVVRVFSDGVQVELSAPLRGTQKEIAVKFPFVRPIDVTVAALPGPEPEPEPEPKTPPERAPARSLGKLADVRVETPVPPAPAQPPQAQRVDASRSSVLVAEAEAALALASEPLRKLTAKLAELGDERKLVLTRQAQARFDARKRYEEELASIDTGACEHVESIDVEITRLKGAKNKLAVMLAQLRSDE
jgi:hypothetical protein